MVRIVQAIGAASGIVVARAIVRDLFERDRAAAMLGLVATAMVIAPTFGPLIGGVLETAFGWQSIFLFVAAASLAVLAWAPRILPETRQRDAAAAPAGFLRRPRGPGAQRELPRLCAVRGLRLGDLLRFSGRRPARGGDDHGPQPGRVRRLVRGELGRLHGGELPHLAAVDASTASTG